MDRGFRVSGGACVLAGAMEGTGGAGKFVTGQACKAVGGQWRGGHDISGHVFILVLGSLFLSLEVLPVLVRGKGGREERVVVGRDGRVGGAEREAVGEEGEEGEGEWRVGVWAPMVVAGLSWWMLLMTAAYFHTWFEKVTWPFSPSFFLSSRSAHWHIILTLTQFTGLLTAFIGIFVVYFLPRASPAMRDIIGMPGV